MTCSLAYQTPISAAVDAAFPIAAASLTEKLPAILRVESITYQPHANGVLGRGLLATYQSSQDDNE